MHNRLDEVSLFLEEVNLYGTSTTLSICISIEGLLKEEKHRSHQSELMLETSSFSACDITVELEEKREVNLRS